MKVKVFSKGSRGKEFRVMMNATNNTEKYIPELCNSASSRNVYYPQAPKYELPTLLLSDSPGISTAKFNIIAEAADQHNLNILNYLRSASADVADNNEAVAKVLSSTSRQVGFGPLKNALGMLGQ